MNLVPDQAESGLTITRSGGPKVREGGAGIPSRFQRGTQSLVALHLKGVLTLG